MPNTPSGSRQPKFIFAILTIIVSGFCWYFGNGLNGDYWYLVWLAPIPVLIFAYQSPVRPTLLVSFLAYLLGRLSWFPYLVKVATPVLAIAFTVALPLFFVLIVFLTRRAFIRTWSWYSVFAFPVFFTCFEFIAFSFSPDGTAGSIAYSQSNLLSLVQLTSVTGIFGITFFINFVPSVIVALWYFRNNKSASGATLVIALLITALVFSFGIIRLAKPGNGKRVKAGLVVLEEKKHDMSGHPDFQKEIQHIADYANEIQTLAAGGAKMIVLPERALNINSGIKDTALEVLRDLALKNQVTIITGYTNFIETNQRNSALVIDAAGNIIGDYNKCHLVTGLESQFTPGNKIGLLENDFLRAGVAICKDLDYPGYIKTYGNKGVDLLYIPAWDFVTDDWLHSRMSILRGVENGFSEIRTARQGRLTISDPYGRVKYEANASNGSKTSLLGEVSPGRQTTLYSKWGNWFGILNLVAGICFLLLGFKRRK